MLFSSRAVADSYVGNHILFTSLGDQERSANGCWSFVGNVGPQGGKAGQSLNLGRGCMEKEIVFHEVLHALGKLSEKCTKIVNCSVTQICQISCHISGLLQTHIVSLIIKKCSKTSANV